jgi:hypothetical protein
VSGSRQIEDGQVVVLQVPLSVFSPVLTHAHACSRMLTYAHVCSRMLTYAHVCSRMLTYTHELWRMLTYADVCWQVDADLGLLTLYSVGSSVGSEPRLLGKTVCEKLSKPWAAAVMLTSPGTQFTCFTVQKYRY